MNLEQELYRHIASRYPQARALDGFDANTDLIASGVFDYVGLMNLVFYIEKIYAIQFSEEELVPEHFDSIGAVAQLVEGKIAAQNRPSPTADDVRYAQMMPHWSTYSFGLGTVVTPYIMRHAPANFRSQYVNTDAYGFRLSYDAEGVVDSQSWWQRKRRGVVMGNSLAFGKGASNDRASLVSVLNAHSDYSFLNLGVLAGNSTQELITALPFLSSTECVLLCSGGANLNLNLMRASAYDLYGCFAGEEILGDLGQIEFQHVPNALTRSAPQLRQRIAECAKPPAVEIPLTSEEAEARMNRALELERRDLQMLVRICGPSTPMFFALQLFVGVAKPNLTVEEQFLSERLRRRDKIWTKAIEPYSDKLLLRYSQSLKQICSELGIVYTDLNHLNFEGWCFYDHGHLTDKGYRLVGEYLAGWTKRETGKHVGTSLTDGGRPLSSVEAVGSQRSNSQEKQQ
jgi:acyl carrier protein